MLQSHHPQQILPSPARLGLTNPNSPSVPNPSTPKLSSTSQQPQQQQQQTATPTVTKTSSTLLSLLPPLPRAQSLLLQMAALATKLFDISPNRSHWITAFRGSLPSFLPSQTQTHTADAVSSTKEILSSFTSLQTQLFEAVAQLQEILDLQDAKQKVAHDIRSMDNSILAFTKKLKEAVQVLELLVDDYSDYRQPKRLKSGTSAPSTLNLSDILSYAHRISYTTFAPPEFGAGEAPLRGALPPAPQDEQMRASQLYNFADLDVGLPKEVETKEKAVETLIETSITLIECLFPRQSLQVGVLECQWNCHPTCQLCHQAGNLGTLFHCLHWKPLLGLRRMRSKDLLHQRCQQQYRLDLLFLILTQIMMITVAITAVM